MNDFYLIDYLCKDGKAVWTGKAIAKAKNAVHAWDKFKNKWEKDFKEGKADVSIAVVIKYSVERVCPEKEAIL